MKLVIEVSDQTAEYLRRLAAEIGPLTQIETIAAHMVETIAAHTAEKAAQQAQWKARQAQQDK